MMKSRSIRSSARLAALAAGLLVSAAAFAQVTVQDAWVRGTVPPLACHRNAMPLSW